MLQIQSNSQLRYIDHKYHNKLLLINMLI